MFTLVCLICFTAAQAQYFQHNYNLNYSFPKIRNEGLNSGIITRVNYINQTPAFFYHVGIGTSYKNPNLPFPDNTSDRLRFVQLGTNGLTQYGNLGHQYFQFAGQFYNSIGNSIAEIKNTVGTGGFVAVGAVTNNQITGANNIPGGSDMLFTRLDANGNVITARRIDFDGGKDIANCIRSSATLVNNQRTWIVCGQSAFNGRTDCFVARVFANGNIVWSRRFNFDVGGGLFNSAFCIANQLCENANGNIFVVGTLRDNPVGPTGTDGLAFALNANGNLLWANNYHAATDDEFQAVRISAAGTLAIGGFTNFTAVAPVNSHMLFVELTTANGNIVSQNVLRAVAGANIFTSKCYDLVQGLNNQYFMVGPMVNGGIYQMMYRTNQIGLGNSWYRYNAMNNTVGFGVDNSNILPTGISYFSSEQVTVAPTFSNSNIMHTDYNGATCNICPGFAPSNQNIFMQKFARENKHVLSGTFVNLLWQTFNYDDTSICSIPFINCNKPLANLNSNSISNNSVDNATVSESIQVSAYPNPVINVVVLSLSNAKGISTITLNDINGVQVWQSKTTQSKVKLDMSTLHSGTYLLTIKDDINTKKIKLIKE